MYGGLGVRIESVWKLKATTVWWGPLLGTIETGKTQVDRLRIQPLAFNRIKNPLDVLSG